MLRSFNHLRRACAERCADERGIALVMVLIVMCALSISLVAVMSYSSSSSTATYVGNTKEKASSLAEAGLSDAFSIIALSGTDTNAVKLHLPDYPADPGSTIVNYPSSGMVTWGATYDASTKTYTIKSIGSYPNPSGTGTIWASAGAAVQIVAPPYTFASLNSTCEKHALIVTLGGQLTVTNGIYVNSCDNGHDAFDVK